MDNLNARAREYHQRNLPPFDRRRLKAQTAVALRTLVEGLAAGLGLSSAEAIEDGLQAGLCALEEFEPRLDDSFEDLATDTMSDALKSWAAAQ